MIRFARSAAAALALVVAVPATALADARQPDTAEKTPKQKDGSRRQKQFPMKAETFKAHVDKRIAHARSRLDQVLDARQVPDAKRAEIKKEFEAGAVAVRAAADRAAKDGEVTQEEAKEVRDLAHDLKQKAREKFGKGKGGGKRAADSARAKRAG